MKTDWKAVAAMVAVSIATQGVFALASRNSGGTYSLPAGNPVVSGTAISSTVHNTTMTDLGTEITDSLNRSGKGAMLAPLQGSVGTVSLPGYTFNGDTDTGLYRIGANNPGMAVGGAKIQEWAAGSSTFSQAVVVNAAAGAGLTATGGSDGTGVVGLGGATNGPGVVGTAAGTGTGVSGSSTTGWGGSFIGNTTKAPLHIGAQSATPSSPTEGDLYVDSDDHKLYLYTGSAWVVAGTQS